MLFLLEDFELQVVETKFDQPELEIINAAETVLPEEPSSPTTPRYSVTPPPPPPPKIAFQEESSISKQNDEPSVKTEGEVNSSSEILNLGRRVTRLHILLKYFKLCFSERPCLPGDRKYHQSQTRGSEQRQLCLHLHDQEWREASEEMA